MDSRTLVEEVTQPSPTGRMPDEPENPTDPMDEEAVTPQQQAFYDQFMNKAVEYIHGPKSSRAVLKHLNQRDLSVPEAVGRTTAMIVKNIVGSAKTAKQPIDSDAVFGAAQEIVEELLQVGSAAKVIPLDWPQDDSEPPPELAKVAQDSLAMAAYYYGDDLTKSGEGKELQGQAQNEVLRQIHQEAQDGTINPEFMKSDPNTVQGGVKRALLTANAREA